MRAPRVFKFIGRTRRSGGSYFLGTGILRLDQADGHLDILNLLRFMAP